MGATRRNSQAQLKILKNHRNTKYTNQNKKSMFSSSKVFQKCVRVLPDGIRPGSLKNNRTQVKFRKPYPEKEKCLGWQEKNSCGIQNVVTDGRQTSRRGGLTENCLSWKITLLSIKSSNSSRTSIKMFEFSVHEINTFFTIVNRK
jgi:hypothetical protein